LQTRIPSRYTEEIHGRRFIIATGTRPLVPPIKGLRESGALTNETVLDLKSLPPSIVILGAGPIGIEYAQIFARLGSKVTVIKKYDRILPKEDPELAGALEKVLESEGVELVRCPEIKELRCYDGKGKIEVTADCSGAQRPSGPNPSWSPSGESPMSRDSAKPPGWSTTRRRG
jgi:pyruvate/2-oxoglutarate dehydrogenase complex dihydrolipoamide dehydrogenase (E3) component